VVSCAYPWVSAMPRVSCYTARLVGEVINELRGVQSDERGNVRETALGWGQGGGGCR